MVSVIIPVYQVSDYVERCIRSVMAQTFTDIECIIVDDATKDDGIVKCERLIETYVGPINFRIVRHEENRGLSAARNTGTKLVNGVYIYYLDSDDDMTPDCLELLVREAQEHPDAEMVVGNTQVLRNEKPERVWIKEDTPTLVRQNGTIAEYYHLRLIPNAAWNKLIKRSFIEAHGLYFKEGLIHEDILWMFYVVKYVSVVVLVKKITNYYHIRPGSISTSTDENTEGINYSVVYDDILHHLTLGREKKELNFYVNDFCKCYLRHKATIPSYEGVHKLYRENAWKYGCWSVYLILVTIRIIGYFGNPSGILECLNALRWKWKRMTISVKTI